MANTKSMSRRQRRVAKRNGRRALRQLCAGLTQQQGVEWRKSGKGIKAFLAEAQKAEKKTE